MAAEMIQWRGTRCPRGHWLRPRHVKISWMPCDCVIARQTAGHGPPGHLTLHCEDCHAEHWQAIRYQPPHAHGHQPRIGPPPTANWPAC